MPQDPHSLFRVWNDLPRIFIAITYPHIRHLLDISAGAIGMVLVVCLIPLLWLCNLIWAPGPLFYRQKRVGLYGEHFLIMKFRSMVIEAEEDGAIWSQPDDRRVTLVGRFLRRVHLDELPQCWNILKGEMSFIGPRPERPEFTMQLEQEIEGYGKRHQIKPGLTGWAQVNYGYGNSIEDARIKLAYDLEYLKRQSITLDLQIIVRTCVVIWRGQSK